MMNYKIKYIKYKTKYLTLLKDSGHHVENRCKYLPCEISNITKKLYMRNEIKNIVTGEPGIDINIIKTPIEVETAKKIETYQFFELFLQDSGIMLKDLSDKNYVVKTKANLENDYLKLHDSNLIVINDVIDMPNIDTNTFGGNFISSPPTDSSVGTVFCIEHKSTVIDYLQKNLLQDIAQIKCSFRDHLDGRHIDECMCFIPYGNNNYKVWIYKIGNINMSELKLMVERHRHAYTKILADLQKLDEILGNLLTKQEVKEAICNLKKIGEYYYATQYLPNKQKIQSKQAQRIKEVKEQLQKLVDQTEKDLLFNTNAKINREIQNEKKTKDKNIIADFNKYTTIITTEAAINSDFNEINLDEIYNHFKTYNHLQYVEACHNISFDTIERKLIAEQKENLNIISMKLFGTNYDDNKEKFVEFPIDILIKNINEDYLIQFYSNKKPKLDYKITSHPIFNRVWVESEHECKLLLSWLENARTSPDSEIKRILDIELTLIRSMLNERKIFNYYFINTKKYNDNGGPDGTGGNLHCLIKTLN